VVPEVALTESHEVFAGLTVSVKGSAAPDELIVSGWPWLAPPATAVKLNVVGLPLMTGAVVPAFTVPDILSVVAPVPLPYATWLPVVIDSDPNAAGAEDGKPGDTLTVAVNGCPITLAEMTIVPGVPGVRVRGTFVSVTVILVAPEPTVSERLGIVYGVGAVESIDPVMLNGVPDSANGSVPLMMLPNVPVTLKLTGYACAFMAQNARQAPRKNKVLK